MAEMKKRRTNLMQKTIAVLLSAVLIAGAVWNDTLPDVRAQEPAGADMQETQQAQTAQEEIPTETAQHVQTPSTQEEPAAEPAQDADGEQPQPQEEPAAEPTQDADGEQTQSAAAQQPTTEQPNDSGSTEEALTERTTDTAAEQTAQEVQNTTGSGNLAEGSGWAIDADGVLTIESDDGFADWVNNGLTSHGYEVKKAVIKSGVQKIPDGAFGGSDSGYCWNMVSVEMPDTVTEIGDTAFAWCGKLQSIEIPETVKRIGMNAFRKTGLTAVTIPDSVEEIGIGVFRDCTKLETCKLPDGLTAISGDLFNGCSALTAITIPNDVTIIEGFAFRNCSALTTVTLSPNLTEIGERAFLGCSTLPTVTIPDKVETIVSEAFMGCSKLAAVVMKGSQPPQLKDIYGGGNSRCFGGCAFVDKEQSVKVPADAVDTYKNHKDWKAYQNCITADIPPVQHTHKDHNGSDITFTAWDSENSLPNTAGNYYLTKDVTLSARWTVPNGNVNICLNGKTVTNTGDRDVIYVMANRALALYDCGDGKITGGKEHGVTNSGTFTMYGGTITDNTSAHCCGGVHNTATGVFYLRAGTISGNTAAQVGNGGGVHNAGIFEMYGGTIKENTAKNGGGVCNDGTFVLHGGIITGNNSREYGGGVYNSAAFTMHAGEISQNSAKYGGGAANGKLNGVMGTITVGGSAVIARNTDLDSTVNNMYLTEYTITVSGDNPPTDAADIGITAKTAPTEGNPVSITGENSADYSACFHSDNASYEIVNDENNVLQLAVPSKGWTLDADGVLTIETDDGFADWKANGFSDTDTRNAVKSVVINNGVTEIPDNAFCDYYRCTNLTSVQIPETVKRIGVKAFGGTGLTSIEIPDSVTEIGEDGFAMCNALAACKLPNSLTSVPQRLFYQCSALTGITIPDSVTKIESVAFSGCTALTDVVLSQNLTEIEQNAFRNCSALTAVTIPDKVGKIGSHAFYNCSKLAAVVMKGSQPPQLEIGIGSQDDYREYPFDGCAFVDKEQSVKVPADAVNTYKNHKDWEVYRDCIAADIPPVQHTHQDHNGREIVFTAWDSDNSLPDTEGNYYLTENVTLTDTWNVPSGETNLCLNGKTISASGTERYRVITIPESNTLNLYDSQNAGNITGGKGGGVMNNGTFRMYGGKISKNEGEVSGGGVNNQGVFCMYGGEISGNRADNYGDFGCVGGGVYIGKGTFSMYGGKISGNTASTGGGVGSLSIAGTSFIYNEPLTIGGDAVISGNTCNEKENNVCLNDGQTITIESSNPLSGFAKVGITTETAPTDASPVNITGTNGADYSSFFTSDNAAYTVENGTDNTVLLTLKQTHSHIWAETWSSDATHHWHACTVDGCPITENAGKGGYAAHTEDSGTVTTPPTQETAGVRTYKCSVCGYVMRTEEVEKLPPTHEHTYGADWKTDADSHWHECTDCGDKKDLAAHTPDDGTVTKEPTKNETGIKTYKCSVCGYTMRTETLPATDGGGDKPGGEDDNPGGGGDNPGGGDDKPGGGDDKPGGGDDNPGGGDDKPGADKGEISQEIQKGENAPDTKIPIPEKELGDLVLTPEDKEETEKGSDIKILLIVTDAENIVSDDDKKAVNSALNGYKIGQYLDISLFKVIGTNRDKVTETAGKVRIVITIPDVLKNTNTKKTRTFGVIRVHNSQAVFLNDMDTDENTITIETDRFSTYAIVYKDTSKKGSGGGGSSHKNDSTDSSSNSASTAPVASANAANTAAAADLNAADALNTVDALNTADALNAADTLTTAIDQTANADRNGQGKDSEPKTGDRTPIELYATLAMISALSYFALYFKERKRGITEAEKKAFTGKLVQWARQGGRLRKLIAIMIAFVYLAYYHSIGKQVVFAWEEVYEKE